MTGLSLSNVTELIQLLTPDGRRVTTATGRETEAHARDAVRAGDAVQAGDAVRAGQIAAHAAQVSTADLLDLYTDMVVVRRLDEEATALQRQGELGLWAPLRGQEAAQVGSARALAPDDMAFPSYREHGVAYCRGVDPVAILGLFRGVSHGGWDPAAHGFALYAIVVGSQTLHATGYAMGVSWDGGRCATVTYFGDGASSQGDVNEALGWAAVFGAPVVFFCQNNQYAISEPTALQSRVPICQRAAGYGFPGVRVDGNDVLATLAVTRWALERARSGAGPTLVEAVTYRMGAHTTADDPTRYRRAAEVAEWAERDPIARVGAYLRSQGALDAAGEAAIAAQADDAAADLRRRCLQLPDPAPLTLFDHVTVEESRQLAAEREDLADLLAGGTDPAGPEFGGAAIAGADADEFYPTDPYPVDPGEGYPPHGSGTRARDPRSSAAPQPAGPSAPPSAASAAAPVAAASDGTLASGGAASSTETGAAARPTGERPPSEPTNGERPNSEHPNGGRPVAPPQSPGPEASCPR